MRKQEELEALQRAEEDRLLQQLMEEREREKRQLESEVDREWESRIKELTAKFDAEMDRKGKKDKKVRVVDVSDVAVFCQCGAYYLYRMYNKALAIILLGIAAWQKLCVCAINRRVSTSFSTGPQRHQTWCLIVIKHRVTTSHRRTVFTCMTLSIVPLCVAGSLRHQLLYSCLMFCRAMSAL